MLFRYFAAVKRWRRQRYLINLWMPKIKFSQPNEYRVMSRSRTQLTEVISRIKMTERDRANNKLRTLS